MTEAESAGAERARKQRVAEQWIDPIGPLYGIVLTWAWQACAWSKWDPDSLTEKVLSQFRVLILAPNERRFDVVPKPNREGNWGPERDPAIDQCGRIFHELAPGVDSDREATATRCFLALAAVALRAGIQAQADIRDVDAAKTKAYKDSFAEYLDRFAYQIHVPVDVVPRAWALVPLHAATAGGKPAKDAPPPILKISDLPQTNRHRNDVWWKAFTETCGRVLEGRTVRARAEAQAITADLVADGKALPLLSEVLQALRAVEEYAGQDPTRVHRDLVWYGRLWLWLDLLREIAQLATPQTQEDMRQKALMVGSNVDALDWFDELDAIPRHGRPPDSLARTGIAPPIPLLWKPYWPKTKVCPILRQAATGLFGREYKRANGRP